MQDRKMPIFEILLSHRFLLFEISRPEPDLERALGMMVIDQMKASQCGQVLDLDLHCVSFVRSPYAYGMVFV